MDQISYYIASFYADGMLNYTNKDCQLLYEKISAHAEQSRVGVLCSI